MSHFSSVITGTFSAKLWEQWSHTSKVEWKLTISTTIKIINESLIIWIKPLFTMNLIGTSGSRKMMVMNCADPWQQCILPSQPCRQLDSAISTPLVILRDFAELSSCSLELRHFPISKENYLICSHLCSRSTRILTKVTNSSNSSLLWLTLLTESHSLLS